MYNLYLVCIKSWDQICWMLNQCLHNTFIVSSIFLKHDFIKTGNLEIFKLKVWIPSSYFDPYVVNHWYTVSLSVFKQLFWEKKSTCSTLTLSMRNALISRLLHHRVCTPWPWIGPHCVTLQMTNWKLLK